MQESVPILARCFVYRPQLAGIPAPDCSQVPLMISCVVHVERTRILTRKCAIIRWLYAISRTNQNLIFSYRNMDQSNPTQMNRVFTVRNFWKHICRCCLLLNLVFGWKGSLACSYSYSWFGSLFWQVGSLLWNSALLVMETFCYLQSKWRLVLHFLSHSQFGCTSCLIY